MGIIKKGAEEVITQSFETEEDIPFVPAWDLYEAQKKRLSEDECVAIAAALLLLTETEEHTTTWRSSARIQAVSNRIRI